MLALRPARGLDIGVHHRGHHLQPGAHSQREQTLLHIAGQLGHRDRHGLRQHPRHRTRSVLLVVLHSGPLSWVDLAVAQHLPQGRCQAGDRHLNFHETRDNLSFGVAPICRVLTAHGVPIAPETYYARRRRSTPRSATPTGSSKLACRLRSGASATATTTPWPRLSTACTRPSSCSGQDRGREPTTSSSRPWDGSTGSTTPGCTPPWATGPQPRSNPSTTVRTTPPSDRSWENPPCSEPGAIHTPIDNLKTQTSRSLRRAHLT